MTPRNRNGFKKRNTSFRGGRSREKSQGGRKHFVRHSHGIRKLKGTLEKNPKGFGFLILESRDEDDIFAPPRTAERLFHGDRVLVTLNSQNEILEVEVLEHRFRELVGRYLPHPGHPSSGWVIYERRKVREEVFVPQLPSTPKTPNAEDWIRARLNFNKTGPFPVTAEILEVYGPELPASADIGMIAAEYNLIEHHSPAAIQECEALDREVSPKNREDLRNIPFITIDGETARDFDDAIFVERQKSGYILWVAVADVSHYVHQTTITNKEARARGTSVYFPERAFHMLPRVLSENLCSLRPNEPRYALVAKMEFDRHGRRMDTQLIEAVIESQRRATYNEIQAECDANIRNPHWEYFPHFELYRALRKRRADRGSIDFNLPEAQVLVNSEGEVQSITRSVRLDSHRLIEEFMIVANEAVTEWMLKREWPFVYRIHDEPSSEKLEKFRDLAATVGFRFTLKDSSDPRIMAEIIRRAQGLPAQALLNMAFLRSMKQAIYSSIHGGHYGLASEAYTHFTSPIRRYPDLVVHRLLRWALHVEAGKVPPLNHKSREKLEEELSEITEHCSYRERLAADAERDSIRLKQTRAMRARLGDEFAGQIIGLSEAGLFVQVENPYAEGLVAKESIGDDYYEFNEERMVISGRRKKRTFKVGELVRVRAVRADLERRLVDFTLL